MALELDGLHKGRSVIAAKEQDIYRALPIRARPGELSEGTRRYRVPSVDGSPR
jgi:hypothetical protein